MSPGRLVTLTPEQYEHCLEVAKIRQGRAEQLHGDRHRVSLGPRQTGLGNHRMGCLGEHAFANWLGVPWDATTKSYKKVPDQSGCDVRCRSEDWHELGIREEEPRDRPYVKVTRRTDRDYLVHGWAWGYEVDVQGRTVIFYQTPVRVLYNRLLRQMPELLEVPVVQEGMRRSRARAGSG